MTHSFSVVRVREAWRPSWLGRVSTVGTNAALKSINVLFVGGRIFTERADEPILSLIGKNKIKKL